MKLNASLRSVPGAITTLACALLLVSCGGGGGYGGDTAPPVTLAPQVTLTLSNGAGVSGAVVVTLEATKAPVTTANFLAYVKAGFYNGTVIHRHSPGFVLQGGGYAGPVTATALPPHKVTTAAIVLEDNAGLLNLKLTLAMARGTAPDSATSEFFINLADNVSLNRSGSADNQRGYAVFGAITAGSDVVTAMTTAPCVPANFVFSRECLPVPNITIVNAVQTR